MQVQQAVRGFNDLDIQIVVVTFQPERVARQYAVETKLPWPVLIDEHRELYRSYGMGKPGSKISWVQQCGGRTSVNCFEECCPAGHRVTHSNRAVTC